MPNHSRNELKKTAETPGIKGYRKCLKINKSSKRNKIRRA